MLDIRQTENYARYLETQGWIVKRIDNVNYFLRKLPLVGYVLKIQRPEKLDFLSINRLIGEYRIFQVIIEPKDKIQEARIKEQGYKLTKSPYLPPKTLQIDLSQNKEDILKHFKKDARQAIKRGGDFTIHEYSSINQIKIFRQAWKKAVNFKRFVPGEEQLLNLRKSFPHNRSLFLASHNISGRIIGGVIFTTSSHGRSNYITYYWSAFTSKAGRTSLSQYSLLYFGILWAKKMGYKYFDFEGIYDPRFPDKSWLGFTHFKKSFGGFEVLYPGCYTNTRIPWL